MRPQENKKIRDYEIRKRQSHESCADTGHVREEKNYESRSKSETNTRRTTSSHQDVTRHHTTAQHHAIPALRHLSVIIFRCSIISLLLLPLLAPRTKSTINPPTTFISRRIIMIRRRMMWWRNRILVRSTGRIIWNL